VDNGSSGIHVYDTHGIYNLKLSGARGKAPFEGAGLRIDGVWRLGDALTFALLSLL
jgi:hypothetical protein